MKISYNWLKSYINLNDTPEEVSNALTSIGLEVEGITLFKGSSNLKGVVVGRVMSCEKHPDADKLTVTTVDVGGSDNLQIVCGAPNVKTGQTVAVATIGTTLYFSSGEEVKIKKSKIRGIESFGMLCAEDELGIGSSHEGIMVLDPLHNPGKELNEVFKLTKTEDDYVFEIGLTPNRSDAASHIGVARDLAAFYKTSYQTPDVSGFKTENNSLPISVEVSNHEACPRYSGITVSGVKVTDSPDWMKHKLRAIGINTKNNIVDITNYILHEYGQPLHAFDADKIAGKKITVKTCAQATEFVTLDGQTRKLDATDLMICDAEKPMCIAGVFGGTDSGVTDTTVNIFIESAYFNPVWVRKTARRHGIFTDSSFRFERGTDPNGTVEAMKRAVLMIIEIAGGQISSNLYDIYPKEILPQKIQLSYSRIISLIGKNIPKDEICSIIKALDIKTISDDGDNMEVSVPTYRVDVRRECDIIEDILRIYGYNNIEIPQQVLSTLNNAVKPDVKKIINRYSDFLTSNGFYEIMSNSLTKAAYYNKLNYKLENCAKILNPLSNDLNVMRQTLIFGGLEAISRNLNRKNADLKLYENGNCYTYTPSKADGTLNPYSEEARLAIFITGNTNEASWNKKAEKTDFFTLKAITEKLIASFGINFYNCEISDAPSDIFSDGMTLKDKQGNIILEMGIVSKAVQNIFDIDKTVYCAEIRRNAIVEAVKQTKNLYKELPRFPEVRRDLALVVNQNVNYATLRNIALRTEKKLCNVGIFDIYEGEKLPEGKKQYALSFIIQDKDKTLNDSDINNIVDKLLQAFEKETGAALRA